MSQIPIGSIPISLGSSPFSSVHTPIPQPTWGTPSQPLPTPYPVRSHLAPGLSSLHPPAPPFQPPPPNRAFPPTSTPSPPQPTTLPLPYPPPTPHTVTHFAPTYTHPTTSISGPRHLKIELPRFFGEDSYGWLAMAEKFLDYHEVEDRRRVTVASLHLSGDTAHWLQWFKLRFPLASWATFTTQLLQQFGPTDSLNFHMALSHITQTDTVEAYVGHFICLSCRTPDWSDEQLLGAFLGGLKDDLQDDVVAQCPTSLARAIELARIYEQKNGRRSTIRSGFSRATHHFSRPPPTHTTTPANPPPTTTPRPTPPALPPPPSKPILRLTQAEMRTRREQGLCFNCDDQYRSGHRFRQSHILLLLVEDDLPQLDVQHPPHLTLPSWNTLINPWYFMPSRPPSVREAERCDYRGLF